MHLSQSAEAARGPTIGTIQERAHERLEYEIEVGVDTDHQFFTGFTQNISAGGLFIATHAVQPIGTKFHVLLRIPGCDREFNSECEVRWTRGDQGPGVSAGMGVRFLGLTSEEEAIIDEFVSSQETLFYDDE